MEQFNFVDFYDVSITAQYPIQVYNKIFEPGEKIAVFDKIQIADFKENKRFFQSQGGYQNTSRIWWEETKEVRVYLRQGIFSGEQMSLLSGASYAKEEKDIEISQREKLETDNNGFCETKYKIGSSIFVYDMQGNKIPFTQEGDSLIKTDLVFTNLIVDYKFSYNNKIKIFSFGQELSGFLSMEGRTRVKDDENGQVKTGILNIPKLKLLSSLSMELGSSARPILGQLDAVALPDGRKGSRKIMEMTILNDDIDSDI